MYILNFHNLKPLSEMDKLMTEHRAFLAKHVADGTFLVVGAKVPRAGGIIVVNGIGRERLVAVLAEAPFLQRGMATCEITEFEAKYTAPALRSVLSPTLPAA